MTTLSKKACDILIIGGGPAGMTAGIYSARAGFKTVILENLVSGGQINTTPDIANYPGFIEITGSDLAQKMLAQAEKCGVEFLYDEITDIDLNKKTVKTSDTQINCKAIIISSGASPRLTGAVNEDIFLGNGIHTCALCDGAFYKDKDVAVIGGGNSAVEEAIYLSAIAKTVTIVNNTKYFSAQKILTDKLKKLPNIKAIYHEHTLTKIIGEDKVTGMEIKQIKTPNETKQTKPNTKTFNVNGVFLAIGRKPNTDFISKQLNLSKSGYIVTDDKLQTSIAGVFGAGDVIEKHVRQIITACADGAVASIHAAEYIRK